MPKVALTIKQIEFLEWLVMNCEIRYTQDYPDRKLTFMARRVFRRLRQANTLFRVKSKITS